MNLNNANQDLVELQILGQQIRELDQYIASIEQKMVETDQSIRDLENFKNRKEGDELLVPIVPGIFTKAVIKNKDEILIGVGKGVVVKSDIDHAIEILQQQIKELTRHRDEMLVELNGLILRAQELEKKLQKLQK